LQEQIRVVFATRISILFWDVFQKRFLKRRDFSATLSRSEFVPRSAVRIIGASCRAAA
jgi:hypothetical protein